MKYLKAYESYYSDQEYIQDVSSSLSKYNISPVNLKQLLDQYEDQMLSYRDEGKDPQLFVNMVVKDLQLDSGGYLSMTSAATPNQTIKYL